MSDVPHSDDVIGPEEREAVTTELLGQAERLDREIEAADEAEARLRADCELDAADSGAKSAAQDQLRNQARQARLHLEHTVTALGRLRDGTFGICTACSRPIGRERVMAVPTAELCLACRRRREADGSRSAEG
ncbi:MAG TPA: TraR/DksA C4-type zinc finger protein [Streptomyces sp.]|nr:TraR/DksA C4-type zinc finger protein [Streptomyces sp.]